MPKGPVAAIIIVSTVAVTGLPQMARSAPGDVGDVYAYSDDSDSITQYDFASGQVETVLISGPELDGATSIGFLQNGDLLIGLASGINRYSSVSGASLGTFVQDADLGIPPAIEPGPDRYVYVASPSDETIGRFDPCTSDYQQIGVGSPNYLSATDLAVLDVGGQAHLLVSWGHVDELDTSSQLIRTYSDSLNATTSVAVRGADHHLFVGDSASNTVEEFDTATGDRIGTFVSGLDAPSDIVFDPGGNLLIANVGASEIRVHDGETGAFIRSIATADDPTKLAIKPGATSSCPGGQPQGELNATIVFPAMGSSTIDVQVGDTVETELILAVSARQLSSYAVSVAFDEEGSDAFDLQDPSENLPAGFDLNLTSGVETLESAAGSGGLMRSCEAALMSGGVSGPVTACSFQLKVTGPPGEYTIRPGFFNDGVDGAFDALGFDLRETLQAHPGTIVVPEPQRCALLLSGLALLLLLSRSRRPCATTRHRVAPDGRRVMMVAIVAALLAWEDAWAGPSDFVDVDLDGVHDGADSCVGRYDPMQRDSDFDLLGNLCDQDLDDNGLIDLDDVDLLAAQVGRTCVGLFSPCTDADFDGDNVVGLSDFNVLRSNLDGAPGPSGMTVDASSCDVLPIGEFSTPEAGTWDDLLAHAYSLGFTAVDQAHSCGGSQERSRIIQAVLSDPFDADRPPIGLAYSEPGQFEMLVHHLPDGSTKLLDDGGGIRYYLDGSFDLLDASGGAVAHSALNGASGSDPNNDGACPHCWSLVGCLSLNVLGVAGVAKLATEMSLKQALGEVVMAGATASKMWKDFAGFDSACVDDYGACFQPCNTACQDKTCFFGSCYADQNLPCGLLCTGGQCDGQGGCVQDPQQAECQNRQHVCYNNSPYGPIDLAISDATCGVECGDGGEPMFCDGQGSCQASCAEITTCRVYSDSCESAQGPLTCDETIFVDHETCCVDGSICPGGSCAKRPSPDNYRENRPTSATCGTSNCCGTPPPGQQCVKTYNIDCTSGAVTSPALPHWGVPGFHGSCDCD